MRYVTTERRGLSRKEPRPEGLKRHGTIGGVACRSRRCSSYAPSARLATGPVALQPRFRYD
jgi:hypothetical protein